MKVIGLQIESNKAILVVLQKNIDGSIEQTNEYTKIEVNDHSNSIEIKRFRDQINASFDSINPSIIGIRTRNSRAKTQAPSPISFKLEGIIQLYEKSEIKFIAPQTIAAFKKKNPDLGAPDKKYQVEAYEIAYYLLK